MHLADPGRHFPGNSGIIGQSIAHATGTALTAQVKKIEVLSEDLRKMPLEEVTTRAFSSTMRQFHSA